MPRESLSTRLHRLAREQSEVEKTIESMVSTAERVLASVDDTSDGACMGREMAAIALARDVLALHGVDAPKVNGLRLVRGKDD